MNFLPLIVLVHPLTMATKLGVALPQLNWDHKDQTYAFREWKDFLNSYFVINDVDDEKKWHYILLSAGTRGHELWNSWVLSDDDKKDPAIVFEKFEKHLVGTLNKWVMRLELASLIQKEGEAVDDFICRLKAKANMCKFDNEENKNIPLV